ncbi:hypothetical protein CR51_32585 [Caballeronia megalochromosomata]|nr:hypothetical protein CR51_32585 [Caballeronia megalochromosomata]
MIHPEEMGAVFLNEMIQGSPIPIVLGNSNGRVHPDDGCVEIRDAPCVVVSLSVLMHANDIRAPGLGKQLQDATAQEFRAIESRDEDPDPDVLCG